MYEGVVKDETRRKLLAMVSAMDDTVKVWRAIILCDHVILFWVKFHNHKDYKLNSTNDSYGLAKKRMESEKHL